MRGGFLHNEVLIASIEAYFLKLGVVVCREYPIAPGRDTGFVDLFVRCGDQRIVCEAELSASRVRRDVEKATVLRADYLFIVVPNERVARTARYRLGETMESSSGPRISVLPLGQALQQLRNCFPLKS